MRIRSVTDCWFIVCQVVTEDGFRYLPLGVKDASGRIPELTPEVTVPFVYCTESLATAVIRRMQATGARIAQWEVLHSTSDVLRGLLTTIKVSTEACILHPGESIVRVELEGRLKPIDHPSEQRRQPVHLNTISRWARREATDSVVPRSSM
jgi:hypothetical protein